MKITSTRTGVTSTDSISRERSDTGAISPKPVVVTEIIVK